MVAAKRIAWALSVLVAGCVVSEIDYTGKACPCPDGWTCSANVCARSIVPDGAAGKITVANLRGEWSTPNGVRWAWDVTGSKDDFGSYELTLVSQPPGAAGTKVWTASDNPELGRLYLPNQNGGEDLVDATITDGLDPDTTYLATLAGIDSAGNRSTSNQAELATGIVLANQVALFTDARPPGYPVPGSLTVAPGCGVSQSACILFDPTADTACVPQACTAGMCCFENLRWQQLGADTSKISPGSFDQNAYFEFEIASTGKEISYWSEIRLWVNPGNDPATQLYYYHPWTYRPDPTFRRVQVPLRVFASNTNLTSNVLAAGLYGFSVGGDWDAAGKVYLDNIAVWY
jgi:hypothetical protein